LHLGAKKCGTTALKIFMNYHTWFQGTPGELQFFNRPSNWEKGYQWYHDQMPLTFKDEICYEKTPDYFDRPFIPERMAKIENAKDLKFVHVLCDPVRRSFSHFLHMFTVQQVGQWGVGGPQPGFEFLQGFFDLSGFHLISFQKISPISQKKKHLKKPSNWLLKIFSEKKKTLTL